ncbi:cytochrome c oxidase assembly factor 8 isoform X2 [Cottoperca gobio]|uniref:Cytochrome c oxidase assembly factor 8 isoform X2 n=1 Tax=Cottoperca gobio TaxID=56716 RepID=A0A6J2S2G5_COTGO|nr:apoptogenic protein 1, mitochondrial isoform X2 [Cottoperca gobio]
MILLGFQSLKMWFSHFSKHSDPNEVQNSPYELLSLNQRSPYRPAVSSTHDWIGPPNPLSNLRPIVYRVPENESELEKRLRHLRQETEDWNHTFWTKQNFTFNKEKDAFIFSQLNSKGLTVRDEQGRRRALNSEEMAVFYKGFLDTNRIRHANYNKEWYRRNFTITLLMARVALKDIWRTVSERRRKNNGTPAT